MNVGSAQARVNIVSLNRTSRARQAGCGGWAHPAGSQQAAQLFLGSNGRCCDSGVGQRDPSVGHGWIERQCRPNSRSAAAKSPVAMCTLPRLKWHGAQAGSMRNAA
jgi:hypothetical protein